MNGRVGLGAIGIETHLGSCREQMRNYNGNMLIDVYVANDLFSTISNVFIKTSINSQEW